MRSHFGAWAAHGRARDIVLSYFASAGSKGEQDGTVSKGRVDVISIEV